VITGRDEVRAWIEDISGREMTHAVQRSVQDEHGAALTEACRYPDGTNVLCATVFALSDGLITDQTVVQSWDEG
jgi:fumarylacetoacetate (FAA) hydrolase family protein